MIFPRSTPLLFRLNLPHPSACLPCGFRFLAFTLLFSATLAHAQQTPAPVTNNDDVVRVSTDLVTVPVFVTDKSGRRFAGLTQTDFGLRHNGRPRPVAYLAAGSDRVALVFALDASGSARDTIARQREAALALFARFGDASRVAILAFADRTHIALPFTHDVAEVSAAFKLDAQPNRPTAIFDAALAALRLFETNDTFARRERRIIILFSDGLDTASTARATAVINEASARGASIYVIHIPLYAPIHGRIAPRPPAKGFRDLAGRTGGQYFLLGDARHALDPHPTYDLAPIFSAIADDLRSQYLLGYYLDDAARTETGAPHIEVQLTSMSRRGLRVHMLNH